MNLKIIVVAIVIGAISGCGTVRPAQQVRLNHCPPGERCVDFVASPMQASGGGIHKVTFLTSTTKDGYMATVPVVTSNGPDRFDTWGPAFIMGGAHVWAADIQGNAIKSASKNRGPSQVFVLAPEGGDAMAINNTEVGITTEQTLGPGLQPAHFCNTCNYGD